MAIEMGVTRPYAAPRDGVVSIHRSCAEEMGVYSYIKSRATMKFFWGRV